jgi:hypothetical protein
MSRLTLTVVDPIVDEEELYKAMTEFRTKFGLRVDLVRGTEDDSVSYTMHDKAWVCFHCGSRFESSQGAAGHFGDTPDQPPVCQQREIL